MLDPVSGRQGLLPALGAALGAYHDGTARHSSRVAAAAESVGRALGLDDLECRTLGWAAALHDVGKLSVHESILGGSRPLTAEEWSVIRRHPDVGGDLLVAVSPELEPVAGVVRTHHERWDGDGYPRGLAGDDIPLAARIVSVVDAFDAMTTPRAYQRLMTPAAALEELDALAGVQFDPDVVQLFSQVQARHPERPR